MQQPLLISLFSTAPAWSRGTETTSISEDAPVGTQIAVTTTAVNTPTTVSILPTSVGADATTLFSVATDGTNVQLTTAGLLDRETTASFVLHLRCVHKSKENIIKIQT